MIKLKKIERTTGRMYASEPRISVSQKGTFYFSSKAMEKLGVSSTKKVSFF